MNFKRFNGVVAQVRQIVLKVLFCLPLPVKMIDVAQVRRIVLDVFFLRPKNNLLRRDDTTVGVSDVRKKLTQEILNKILTFRCTISIFTRRTLKIWSGVRCFFMKSIHFYACGGAIKMCKNRLILDVIELCI